MIEINNLTHIPVNKNFLKEIIKKVLKKEKRKGKYLSIALVGEERMRRLNRKYLRRKKATDVLAFGENLKSKNPELGEIIICPSIVKKNAKRFETTFKKELVRVLIHGVLHILGYEHPDEVEDPRLTSVNRDEKSEKEAQKMEEKEEYYSGIKF